MSVGQDVVVKLLLRGPEGRVRVLTPEELPVQHQSLQVVTTGQ